LKVKAVVKMAGGEPMMTRTVDIGAHGVGLMSPNPLQPGQTGQIAFDLYFDGKSNPVNTPIRIVHCIYSSGEFKVGATFTGLAPAMSAAIAHYVR
jgi:hypothetical protein